MDKVQLCRDKFKRGPSRLSHPHQIIQEWTNKGLSPLLNIRKENKCGPSRLRPPENYQFFNKLVLK